MVVSRTQMDLILLLAVRRGTLAFEAVDQRGRYNHHCSAAAYIHEIVYIINLVCCSWAPPV